jgi:GYF domain 2
MSKRIGELYHPSNNEPVDIYEGFSWPCLFLGAIWFAVKGMWLWAIGSLLITTFTCGAAWLVFPFFANGMHKKYLREKGWLTEEQAKGRGTRGTTQQSFGLAGATTTTTPLAGVSVQPGTHAPAFGTASIPAPPPLPASPKDCHLAIGGETTGPYSIQEINTMRADGRVGEDAFWWREGMAEWQPVATLTQIPAGPSKGAGLAVAASSESGAPALLRSKSFVFAKLDEGISWKNEYDVLDAEVGEVVLELREGELGSVGKLARMGTASTTSSFDVMFKATSNGQNCFRVKGGGMKSGGTVFNGNDGQLGVIKRAGMFSLSFDCSDSSGNNRFSTKSKGIGVLTLKHEIQKSGAPAGAIAVIDKSEAKQILGTHFDRLNNARKYDYAYHVNLSTDLEDMDKALLLGTVYCIAHVSGRM